MRGTFDSELFAEYRRLRPGPRKRRLASQLIVDNEPLLITLVEQLCGRSKPTSGRSSAAARMGGRGGFSDIPFEDAMQAARVAFSKVLDQFEPSKGRLAYYTACKIRYELQKVERFELHLARVPWGRESERAAVDLIGDARELDIVANEHAMGLVEGAPVTPDELAEWERTGVWPESLDEHLASRKIVHSIPVAPAPADTAWLAFLRRCTFVSVGRIPAWTAHNALRLECRTRGEPDHPRAWMLDELRSRGVRESWTRDRGLNVRGLQGLRVQPSASVVAHVLAEKAA